MRFEQHACHQKFDEIRISPSLDVIVSLNVTNYDIL